MQNILVTGGCGFLGSDFIVSLLTETDFAGRVVNLDKLTYAGDTRRLAGIPEEHRERHVFIRGDICDPKAVKEAMEAHDIDTVVHFAAESHVDRSIEDPDAFIKTNVLGTSVLLGAALRAKTGLRFHLVSTDEVYGDRAGLADADEDAPLVPSSPYAASKAGAELLARAFCRTYGLSLSVSRSSNVYGAFQHPEKLLPMVVLNAMGNSPIGLYGDGQNVRQWLYLRDHSRAVLRVLAKGAPGRTYNLGGPGLLCNREAAAAACDAVDALLGPGPEGPRKGLIRLVADRPGHDLRYAMDGRRAEAELGWVPETGFERGIALTASWYAEHRSLFDDRHSS